MKKLLFILSILLMFPIVANAETSQNGRSYHPLGCAFSGTCSQRNFTDSAKEVGHYRDSYHTVKSSIIDIDGEVYTALEYSNGTKALKKGRYWNK